MTSASQRCEFSTRSFRLKGGGARIYASSFRLSRGLNLVTRLLIGTLVEVLRSDLYNQLHEHEMGAGQLHSSASKKSEDFAPGKLTVHQ